MPKCATSAQVGQAGEGCLQRARQRAGASAVAELAAWAVAVGIVSPRRLAFSVDAAAEIDEHHPTGTAEKPGRDNSQVALAWPRCALARLPDWPGGTHQPVALHFESAAGAALKALPARPVTISAAGFRCAFRSLRLSPGWRAGRVLAASAPSRTARTPCRDPRCPLAFFTGDGPGGCRAGKAVRYGSAQSLPLSLPLRGARLALAFVRAAAKAVGGNRAELGRNARGAGGGRPPAARAGRLPGRAEHGANLQRSPVRVQGKFSRCQAVAVFN
jgi:hypothetical protein